MTHTVVSGDTYWSLARRYGVTVEQLRAWNPGVEPTALVIGSQLNVSEPVVEPEPEPEPEPPPPTPPDWSDEIAELQSDVEALKARPLPVDYSAAFAAVTTRLAALESQPVGQDYSAAIAELRAQVDALASQPQTTGGSGVTGYIDLAKLKGTGSWTTALKAAIAEVARVKAAAGTAPPILVPAGMRIDLTGTFTVPDGFALVAFGVGSFQRSARSSNVDIRWSRATSDPAEPMFQIDHTTFDVQFIGVTIQANSGGTFFRTKGHVLWTSVFRDLGLHGFHHLLGTPAEKFLHTLCTFDGRWNCNNSRAQQITMGGSDSPFAFTRFAHDVGGLDRAGFASGNNYLLALMSSQKQDVTGLYFTVEDQASGVLVANSASDHLDTISLSTIEGRNAGQPCRRDLLRLRGGTLKVTSSRLNYADKPTGTDRGASIVVERGTLVLDGVWHSRANNVPADRPVVLVKAGAVLRAGALLTPDGSPWAVAAETGAKVVALDDTVRVL